jgi:hypothetical protein
MDDGEVEPSDGPPVLAREIEGRVGAEVAGQPLANAAQTKSLALRGMQRRLGDCPRLRL